jgi:hypothetical protein
LLSYQTANLALHQTYKALPAPHLSSRPLLAGMFIEPFIVMLRTLGEQVLFAVQSSTESDTVSHYVGDGD